ncbi:MAG TPA: IPT/TIG domain-containing protein [Pantanalinema sp.]
MRRRLASLCALGCLLVAGCQPPASHTASQGASGEAVVSAPPVEGRILGEDRAAQAQVLEIASGATVALVDGATGLTLGTTVSAPGGSFQLRLPGVSPVGGRPYYLEALKGLGAGGTANRAGAAAARLRTVLFFAPGGWVSLSNAQPGDPIVMSTRTTAVALIGEIRSLALSSLVGTLAGSDATFKPATSAIASDEFAAVDALVGAAIAGDRDPVAALGYDPTLSPASARYGLKPADLVLHPTAGHLSAATGSTVVVTGQNLPVPRSDTLVYLGESPVPWTLNASRTQLTVTVPASGASGWIRIAQGTARWTGPFVRVPGTVGTYSGDPLDPWAMAEVHTLGATGDLYYISAQGLTRLSPSGASTLLVPHGVFIGVSGLAVDAAGDVYVCERAAHRISKVASNGAVSVLAGAGSTGAQDGPGASATFNQPSDLALDGAGNLYVADLANNKIRRITPQGVVSTFAGTGAPGAGDAATSSATFNEPYGITVDAAGANVYVGEWSNGRVRKISGGVVSTLAGGTYGYLDGTGAGARFGALKGVSVDGSGNVYVADLQNHCIRKVTSGGVVTTVAGKATVAGFAEGPPLQALLNYAHHLKVASDGLVYIGDSKNRRIRVYVP